MTRAPRVLVIGTLLGQPMGGVRRHLSELLPRAARELHERGGGLGVLLGREGSAFELPAPIECIASDVPAHPVPRRAREERRALARTLAKARDAGSPFDLVHCGHQPTPSPRALGEVALVAQLHDLRQREARWVGPLRALAARRLHARTARQADGLVFVSESVRDAFVAQHPGLVAPTAVVPNAADGELLAGDTSAALPLDPGYLLHVGHLEPRKNLALLLEMLALDPTLPPLALAGRDAGAERDQLERRAELLGVRDRLHLLDVVDDPTLRSLYAHCACVVVPSKLEGFGLAAEEARAVGCRLAVADAGALPEVAGPTVPRFDPDSPADALRAVREALAGDPTGPSGRSWDSSAGELVAFWTRVADQKLKRDCR